MYCKYGKSKAIYKEWKKYEEQESNIHPEH